GRVAPAGARSPRGSTRRAETKHPGDRHGPRIPGSVLRRECLARGAVLGECRLVAATAQLTARQRRLLQDQGYLVVRSLIDEAALSAVRKRLDELVRTTVAAWAREPSLDVHEACVMAEISLADPGFAACY